MRLRLRQLQPNPNRVILILIPLSLPSMSFSGLSILVTGGTGYIGSHTVVELLTSGAHVTIVDNLSNSSKEVLNRIEQITGKRPEFHELDCRDGAALSRVFESHRDRDSSGKSFDAVIHFAALKAVGESNQKPLEYYDNNLVCTLELLKTMRQFSCYSLVFSSSATVYGVPKSCPIDESAPLSTTNPYGTTKLMIEQILRERKRYDRRASAGNSKQFAAIYHSSRRWTATASKRVRL
jgi:UDP-glucose 4-epimerase